jgi:hypothetical protein
MVCDADVEQAGIGAVGFVATRGVHDGYDTSGNSWHESASASL